MAASGSIWAIDVGQCALKALKCRAHESQKSVVAEAFDYIEYPKILSQPGSEPAELVADALTQFLSRNSVRGDRVAISVSGQAGLARFIKLPPVEAKKIPDIVRYEAKQQIPFDLNDVIWDYQRMGGGSEEEGFALETEVGLFAMKRDAVARTLEPFNRAGIDVDLVQLTPLAIYNFALFDQLPNLPSLEEYDPEDPPESIVVVSLGTDATDLVITNGFRVWQRSVPIGGNHFTKALTKELKLTFAKAEHLKRNASTAQDPKAVFQAMRPVFNDLLTELQRSIGYFASLDRNAKIGRVTAIGNAMKLPGLRRYLSQNLGYEIEKLDEFNRLSGPQVVGAPAFKDNALAFSVCYGLAIQGVARAGLRTNLLPREIVKERLIKQKKPWALAAAAILLLSLGLSFVTFSHALSTVDVDRVIDGVTWKSAEGKADATSSRAADLVRDDDAARSEFKTIDQIGKHLVGGVEGRILWLEVLRVLSQALPREVNDKRPENIMHRRELHLSSIECVPVPELADWFAAVKKDYQPPPQGATPAPTADPNAPPADPNAPPADPGPKGPGWVIQLTGHHHHNDKKEFPVASELGNPYVHNYFIRSLQTGKFQLPRMDKSGKIVMDEVTAGDMGLGYFTLVNPRPDVSVAVADPNGAVADKGKEEMIQVYRTNFRVEMCWQKTRPTERAQKHAPRNDAAAAGAEGN